MLGVAGKLRRPFAGTGGQFEDLAGRLELGEMAAGLSDLFSPGTV